MSSEPKVQVTSEPGAMRQFGKSRLSYQNSSRVSPRTAVGSGVALAVAVCVLVLSGSPVKERSDKTSQLLGVDTPQIAPSAVTLNIPQIDPRAETTPSRSTQARKSIRFPGPEVFGRPRNAPIPPGARVSAILASGASDGPVKAELKEPLVVAGETLLDSGTLLIGTGSSGNERLFIRFRKAVFRDGSVVDVNAQAADSDDRLAGIKGSRIGYRALKLAAGIGLNFVGGLAEGLRETQGQEGAVVSPPTMRNALMNGAARASIGESQDMMNEYRNEKPVIEVDAGTPIYVLFEDSGAH